MTKLDGIRILQIVKGIDIGGNSGGAESFGIRLAQSLREHGLDVSLCAYFQYNTSVEIYWRSQLEQNGIEVFFACPSGKFHLFKVRKDIRIWLRDHHIDIVHSHYQVGTIISASIKLSNNYKFLVRTGHIDLEFGASIYGMISRLIFRDIVYPLLVDCEVGVSRSITQNLNQQIVRLMLHKSAIWIPNAIPKIIDSKQLNESLENFIDTKSEKQWIITTIGILVPRKNIDLLIRAMPEVLSQIPHAKLVITGGGPELNTLMNLSNELGISKYCWFLGQQQNIHSILEKSNIFILPSSSEGTSTVVLEAIQNKVPIIASDIPGNRELIKDGINGWLVPVGDICELTNAIIRAYKHPDEIKRMAEEAYTLIEEYSMSNVCSKYMNIYSSLIQTT